MAIAGRFIYSDLKIAIDADTSYASSLGFDIAGYYQSQSFKLNSNKAVFRTGINNSNIWPRLIYEK